MIDRRALVGLWAGLVGLTLGVLAAVLDSALMAVLAGAAALGGGLVALWMGGALREAEQGERRADERLQTIQRELQETAEQLSAERRARTEPEPTSPAAPAAVEMRHGLGTPGVDPRTEALTDPTTGLFSEAYFKVALDARISAARRHLRPVAVVLLEVVTGLDAGEPHVADPIEVSRGIKKTLRDADTACRMDDGNFALVLEDTPENGAVWTVERVRRCLASDNSDQTMWAGIACYPAHAFSTDELLDQAVAALAAAREWKQDRIEVAVAD